MTKTELEDRYKETLVELGRREEEVENLRLNATRTRKRLAFYEDKWLVVRLALLLDEKRRYEWFRRQINKLKKKKKQLEILKD